MPLKNSKQTNPAPPPETRRRSLLDNHAFVFALSLFCGFAVWMVVTMYFDPQTTVTINDASVNYDYSSSTYTALGLDIVKKQEVSNVRVKVVGSGVVIGDITSADIMVYPSYASVKGSGEMTLRLNARITNTSEFAGDIDLTVESPTTVTVVFDEVSEKTIPVVADPGNISVASGFILNKCTSSPAEVTLRGPTSELERVNSVSAVLSSNEKISDTTTLPARLEPRDENGEPIGLEYATMDSDVANVTLTIYQVCELPLTVDFIGLPTGFDVSSLKYSLSQQTLRVAGPSKVVGNMSTLSVTSFDLSREFAFDRDYQRQIELPTGLVSQDGAGAVTLSFDTTNMDSTTLNISNIRAINVPSNFDIEILSSMVHGVKLYGPAEDIKTLSANSIQAEIDCAAVSMTVGQQTLPVTIQIPSSSRIFATGSYTVQCEVTAK